MYNKLFPDRVKDTASLTTVCPNNRHRKICTIYLWRCDGIDADSCWIYCNGLLDSCTYDGCELMHLAGQHLSMSGYNDCSDRWMNMAMKEEVLKVVLHWHKPCIDKLYISPILCHNGFWDVSLERAPPPSFNFMVPSSLTRNCLWAEHLASLPKLKEYAFHMLAIRSLVPFCRPPFSYSHFPQ